MQATSGLVRYRRTLTKLWLSARVPLVIGTVAVAVLASVGVGVSKFQGWSAEKRQQEVESTTERVASDVGAALAGLEQAIRAAVNEEEIARLIVAGDRASIEARQAKLATAVDGIIAVHLLPAGFDLVDSQARPPLGYAFLDMLRSSASRGKAPAPEVHLFGDENQHVALLMRISDPAGNLVGHVRWAADVGILTRPIETATVPGDEYAELLQPLAKGPPLVLASRGNEGYRQGGQSYQAAVPGSGWKVAYWTRRDPSAPGRSLGGWVMPGLGAALAIVLAAVGFNVVRRRRQEVAPAPAPSAAEEAPVPKSAPAAPPPEMLDSGPLPLPEVEETSDVASPPPEPATTGGLSPVIFRAYDIRGIVGETLTPEIVRDIGRAIGTEAYERGQQTIVAGCDGRLSGPELLEALIEGLRSTGRDVIDIGRVPTPVLYFATYYLNTGSGVIVTGSHNPPEYNGLKMMLGGDTLFGDSVEALRTRIESGELMSGEGGLQSMDVLPEYIRRVTEDIPVALGNAFRVAIDCGNGIAGEVAPKLIRALGHDVVELFCEVDGNFPNHHPDPSNPENLRDLISAVKENEADIGFAFDGDGDRLGVVDGKGRVIWPDLQMMLYARDVLSRNQGAQIVFDVKCTSRLAAVITKLGGKPLMCKTGHSFIKDKMKETGALLAGEMSGHIFFKERWYGFDDAFYAAARMLELLLGFDKTPSEVFAKLPTGIATHELNIKMQEGVPPVFMAKLLSSASFEGAKLTTIDGLRADFKDGWGLVRASNTTPCLVLRFEADNKEALARIQEQFRRALLAEDPSLSLPF